MTPSDSIRGAIVGCIVGDAIGLPYEAMSPARAKRLLGKPDRHRFLFGRGMMSDDGEHTCIVAQALCTSGGDVERFRRSLAWRLRWWLLGVPAGIGGATFRAILKLWLGFPPSKSGVFSAGNGPAMRFAVLGAAISDPKLLREMVTVCTTVTHTDPKAFHGAMTVAVAARCAAANASDTQFLEQIRATLACDSDADFLQLLDRAVHSAAAGQPTASFAQQICRREGVSGYVYETVPVAIHAWLRHRTDYAAAITQVIECGGDTDTVAAITGALIGCETGVEGIPPTWRSGMLEWPRSERWATDLANQVVSAMAQGKPISPRRVGPLVVIRNLFFTCVVLAHVLRRAFPPYH